MMDKRALEVVRNLQRLRGLDNESENTGGQMDRRKTFHNIANGKKQTNIGTLDVAFKKRFMSMSAENEDSGK